MAEPATVEFIDQTQRRRKLQLHDVDGQLRVNLTSALANYGAASFTRLADGLVLEGYKGSDYSAVAFKAGEEVLVEAVSRNAGLAQDTVKQLLEALDQRGLTGAATAEAIAKHILAEQGGRPLEALGQVLRPQYADADAAQPMQHDTETPQAGAAPVDMGAAQPNGIAAPPAAAGQLGPMQLAMTPGASPSPPVSEYNASGKKRRFCGACQNHNLRTPVTFQHQQTCQYRHCPCNLCIKKRSISQAQASKRHMAKASGGMSDSQQHVQVESGAQPEVQQPDMQQAVDQPTVGQPDVQVALLMAEQTA
jgi:GNAT superfamily N-acetyltransferase